MSIRGWEHVFHPKGGQTLGQGPERWGISIPLDTKPQLGKVPSSLSWLHPPLVGVGPETSGSPFPPALLWEVA